MNPGWRSRPPVTLRQRVALTALAVLAVWVVVLTVGVNVVLRDRLSAQADASLQARAQAAAATVEVAADGGFTVRDTTDDTAVDVDTWIFRADRLVEEPPGGTALTPVAAGLAGRGRTSLTTDGSTGNRWYAEPLVRDGIQVGTVVTLTSLAPYGRAGQATLVGTVVLAVLLLVGAYLALRGGVGLALRPVTAMTSQAARWSSDDVDRRFGAARRPVELADLAATLDGVLDRLGGVLRHERHFSAEVSHELRTPLARLATELHLLRGQVDQEGPAAATIRVMADDVAELSGIVGTLLAAARQVNGTAGRCDVGLVVRSLVDRWDPPPVVVGAAVPIVAGVGAEIVQRTLIPLLDNAHRYARSAVTVTVSGRRNEVCIEIADDGPGFTGLTPAEVFEPGRRGDPDDGHPGAGLGLALVRRLVTAADGTVTAVSTPAGATFTVRLPTG